MGWIILVVALVVVALVVRRIGKKRRAPEIDARTQESIDSHRIEQTFRTGLDNKSFP